MPRVGGGGGPFVPPQGTQKAQQTSKSDFASKVKQAQGPAQATEAAKAQQAKQTQQSALTGKVRELAKRYSTGELDKKEATREFVGLVIEERFPQFKKKKKKKKRDDEEDDQSAEERLEEAVTELIDRDPALARRLETQFMKLAKV